MIPAPSEAVLDCLIPAKDWRSVAGMFTGDEFSKQVDEEALKSR